MKPLDSNDVAPVAATSESDEGTSYRAVMSVSDSADMDVPTPRAQSEVVAAARAASIAAPGGASRVSRIVPLGTGAGGEVDDGTPAVTTRDVATRDSDVVLRGPADLRAPDARTSRAAVQAADFAVTRLGTGFGPDEDDEATTVDAGAALADDEREALARRVHSAMMETARHGTPAPEPVHPLDGIEAARDRRSQFKQTMLLGLPMLETPLPPGYTPAPARISPTGFAAAPVPSTVSGSTAAPVALAPAPMASASAPMASAPSPMAAAAAAVGSDTAARPAPAVSPHPTSPVPAPVVPVAAYHLAPAAAAASVATEPALLASVVRVVGPPTQPPPRRSRRASGPGATLESNELDPAAEPARAPEQHDHEAFVLTHPIVSPEPSKRGAVPPPSKRSADSLPGAVSSPLTGHSNQFAVAIGQTSLPGVILPPAPRPEDFEPASSPDVVRPPTPSLRATVDPRSSLARTRPPMSQRSPQPPEPSLDELPSADPFAGFVAPQPSAAQRWLVVIVVALAVVGLCSIAAIALGFLGKTGR